MEIAIREATREDLSSIIDLACQSVEYSISPLRNVSLEEAKSFRKKDLGQLRDVFGMDNLGVFIAENEDKLLLGHIIIMADVVEATTGEKQGWILDLSVRKGYWNQGIGSLLNKKAEEFIRSKGLKYIGLGVTTCNERAVNFYHKLGYIEERKRMIKRL